MKVLAYCIWVIAMFSFGLAFYLSHHIFDDWFWNFLSYMMPGYLLVLSLSIILLLVMKRWWLAGICFLALFFLQKPLIETFSLGYFFDQPKMEGEEINLLTFNASNFNNHRLEAFVRDDSLFREDFMAYLKRLPEKPDILCFQEFHHDDGERTSLTEEIIHITDAPYYYTVPIWQEAQGGFFGIVTFSRYPIIRKGLLYMGDSSTQNKGIYTDLLIGKDTLRIINIHLHSMNIRLEDTAVRGAFNKARVIYGKLKLGDEKRREQLKQVLNKVDHSPYPIILCGDFNSFPYSYSYQTVKKRLHNSFEEAGFGFGYTLNIMPYMVRLDNIFFSDPLKPVSAKVVRKFPSSDHFALTSKLILPLNKKVVIKER